MQIKTTKGKDAQGQAWEGPKCDVSVVFSHWSQGASPPAHQCVTIAKHHQPGKLIQASVSRVYVGSSLHRHN